MNQYQKSSIQKEAYNSIQLEVIKSNIFPMETVQNLSLPHQPAAFQIVTWRGITQELSDPSKNKVNFFDIFSSAVSEVG